MNRLSPLLIAVLVVGLIAIAPNAEAQVVDPMPPPTPDEMRAERELMQQRVDRFDRGLVTAETAVERIREPEVRADVQQRLQDIRQRQQAWEQDWTAFQEVTPEQFHERRAVIDDRLTTLERDIVEARLRAAVTPAEFRAVSQEYLDLQREAIQRHHERLAELPSEARAEAAWELIQLRGQFDALHRQHVMMQHVPQARFVVIRPEFTTTLPAFHADVQRMDFEWRMHPDLVAGV